MSTIFMSLPRLTLSLLGTWGMYATFTSPTSASQQESLRDAGVWESVLIGPTIHLYADMFKLLACTSGITEILIILVREFPSNPHSQRLLNAFIHGPISLVDRISITPSLILGCGLATLGGLIRVACYRTLGRFFNFRVTISNKHQLITSGPYKYIRHPSYTAALMSACGFGIWQASHGSWLSECGILETRTGQVVSSLYAVMTAYLVVIIVYRVRQEDEMLRNEFGRQWHDWAKRVPYRLLPHVW